MGAGSAGEQWAGAVLLYGSRTQRWLSWIFLSFWEGSTAIPSSQSRPTGMMKPAIIGDDASSPLCWKSLHVSYLLTFQLTAVFYSYSPPQTNTKLFHSRPCKQTQSTNHPSNEHLRWWRRGDCEMAAGSLAARPALEGFGMRLPLRSAAALCPLHGRRQLQPDCRETPQELQQF